MTKFKSILVGVALGLAMGAFLAGAWWVGGKDVCAGYMARYDISAGACFGGKLPDKSYVPSVGEQCDAALSEGFGWLITFALLIAVVLCARFIRDVRGGAVNARSSDEA